MLSRTVAIVLVGWSFWLAGASTCQAQRFVLPLDVHQGLVFGHDRPQTPYVFAASLAPGLEFEPVQLNLVAAPTYANPRWDAGFGAEASVLMSALVRDVGLRLSARGLYLVREEAVRVSLGVGVEALGLLRIGLWPAYDFEVERFVLTTALGIDLVSLVRALSGPQETEFEPVPGGE